MSAVEKMAMERAAADLRRVADSTRTLAPSASVRAAGLAQEIELRIRKFEALQ